MIKLEQIIKLMEEAYGLDNKSISDELTPCADVIYYGSSGGEVITRIYLNGYSLFEKNNATTNLKCEIKASDEKAEEFVENSIKALRECKALRNKSVEEYKKNKTEMLRKEYEAKMQSLSDEYMAKINAYEGK